MKSTIPLHFIVQILKSGGAVIPSPNSGNPRIYLKGA
jgi:hypothetical protein